MYIYIYIYINQYLDILFYNFNSAVKLNQL